MASGSGVTRAGMSGWSVVRWTGVLGLAAIGVQILGVVVSLPAASAPAIDEATKFLEYAKNSHFASTTVLILFFIGFVLFIGFNAGLRAIATAAAPEHEWLATTTFGAGVAMTVIGIVGLTLGLAALAIAVSSHADAAQIRLLYETELIFGGAPWLVPAAFYLGAAGSLCAATRILPRWLALVGWIASVMVFAAALSAYGSSNPKAFWSANGGVTLVAFLPFWVWTLCASVVFLRKKETLAR